MIFLELLILKHRDMLKNLCPPVLYPEKKAANSEHSWAKEGPISRTVRVHKADKTSEAHTLGCPPAQ